MWGESQAERWEVLWVDYGGQVTRLWAQPMAVAFGQGSRLSRHWRTPTCWLSSRMVATPCSMFGLPARIDDAATLQFDETAKVCAALSWALPLLAGHYPLAMRNLDCISASGL